MTSAEHIGDDVSGWFEKFLGRAPTAADSTYYTNLYQGGTTDQTIVATLLGSNEFFGDADALLLPRHADRRPSAARCRSRSSKIGDEVMTMSGAARPIKWIGRRSYGGRFVMGRKDILPICIKAGALDDNVPRRDLWISPHHAMYLDGVLIEAKDLVNGVSIVQAERVEKVEYFHIELETHDVIIAEGALSESFIDDDSRGMFHNAHEYGALYPDARAAAGAILRAAARGRLRGRGGAAAHRAARRACRAAEVHGVGALRGYVDRVSPRLHCRLGAERRSSGSAGLPRHLCRRPADRSGLANRYREDLEQAGLGSGRHGFDSRRRRARFRPRRGRGAPLARRRGT